MEDIEEQLRNEETAVLQEKLRTNSYVEAAAVLARAILAERGASAPVPQNEEEAEKAGRDAIERSTAKFLVVVAWLTSVFVFKLYEPEKRYVLFASGVSVATFLGIYRKRR